MEILIFIIAHWYLSLFAQSFFHHRYSAHQMLSFAFKYFKLDYKSYIFQDQKYLRPDDFKKKSSNSKTCFKKNDIPYNYKIYGRKMIYKMIKYYLNERKHKFH